MQRCYVGLNARLVIDAHGHLWLESDEGEVQPVPFVYHAGGHAIVLPFTVVQDLGAEAYGQFSIDAAEQGIAVLSEIPRIARAEWLLEQREQEQPES